MGWKSNFEFTWTRSQCRSAGRAVCVPDHPVTSYDVVAAIPGTLRRDALRGPATPLELEPSKSTEIGCRPTMNDIPLCNRASAPSNPFEIARRSGGMQLFSRLFAADDQAQRRGCDGDQIAVRGRRKPDGRAAYRIFRGVRSAAAELADRSDDVARHGPQLARPRAQALSPPPGKSKWPLCSPVLWYCW